MMNPHAKALALGLTGTPQEIVNALKAYPLHVRNVYITGGPADTESVNLLHLLTARHAVMTMGPSQQWQGPLIDMEAGNPAVAQIMSLLRPHLQVNDTKVYCAASVDAANMLNALTQVVGNLTGKMNQVVAEVALLSGGRIGAEYANLTVEEYALQKAAYEADQAAATAAAARTTKINQWKNRVTSAVTEWSDGFVTEAVAELTAVAAEMEA